MQIPGAAAIICAAGPSGRTKHVKTEAANKDRRMNHQAASSFDVEEEIERSSGPPARVRFGGIRRRIDRLLFDFGAPISTDCLKPLKLGVADCSACSWEDFIRSAALSDGRKIAIVRSQLPIDWTRDARGASVSQEELLRPASRPARNWSSAEQRVVFVSTALPATTIHKPLPTSQKPLRGSCSDELRLVVVFRDALSASRKIQIQCGLDIPRSTYPIQSKVARLTFASEDRDVEARPVRYLLRGVCAERTLDADEFIVPCDILPVPPRDLDGPRLVQEVRVNLRIQRAGLKYGSTGEVASASSIPDSASTCARAHLEFGLREMLGPRRRFASLVCLLFMVVVTTAQWDAGEEIGTEMKIARGRYARLQRISFYLGLHEDHWAGDSSGVGRDAKWRWISTRQRAHCPTSGLRGQPLRIRLSVTHYDTTISLLRPTSISSSCGGLALQALCHAFSLVLLARTDTLCIIDPVPSIYRSWRSFDDCLGCIPRSTLHYPPIDQLADPPPPPLLHPSALGLGRTSPVSFLRPGCAHPPRLHTPAGMLEAKTTQTRWHTGSSVDVDGSPPRRANEDGVDGHAHCIWNESDATSLFDEDGLPRLSFPFDCGRLFGAVRPPHRRKHRSFPTPANAASGGRHLIYVMPTRKSREPAVACVGTGVWVAEMKDAVEASCASGHGARRSVQRWKAAWTRCSKGRVNGMSSYTSAAESFFVWLDLDEHRCASKTTRMRWGSNIDVELSFPSMACRMGRGWDGDEHDGTTRMTATTIINDPT
ncbi:hypothetical protein C8R45DRAFT_1083912 [Mycena sanguinolenta]|nr:hypothetical protein C8R45DRAFT_1083912 [Mycena sanguinolenta]